VKIGAIKVYYGEGLLEELSGNLEHGLLVTMGELWDGLSGGLPLNCRRYFVENLEEEALEQAERALPPVDAVVGVGGGSAMDTAKYFAWRRSVPLYQVPSIASVDACFSQAIAVRRNGKVNYVGQVTPQGVYVDYRLIREAPPELNRAGIGDLLSCHTALYDWRLSAAKGLAPAWDEALALGAERRLAEVYAATGEIAAVSPKGIYTLMEGFRWVAQAEKAAGHCRFEEGSEHYFAYNYEYRTGRKLLHGWLVSLGVYAMARLQGNDPNGVILALRRAGLDIAPQSRGIPWPEIEETLRTLYDYVSAEALPYSVINAVEITPSFIRQLKRELAGE
jgi:glycerol-1-phosphate dehydrogenase [NAD(P)+]